jgi:hypothetical protein
MQRPQPDDDAWHAGHCSGPLICETRGKTQPATYSCTKAGQPDRSVGLAEAPASEVTAPPSKLATTRSDSGNTLGRAPTNPRLTKAYAPVSFVYGWYRPSMSAKGSKRPCSRTGASYAGSRSTRPKRTRLDRIRAYDLDIWKNFYAASGLRKAEGNDIFGSLANPCLFVLGTVDSVRQQPVEQWQVMPGENIALVNHYAQMPKDRVIE